MKALKKISVIIMAVGIIMILGKMGESDLESVSVAETLSGVLLGGAVASFGKALNAGICGFESRRAKCKKIPFARRGSLKTVGEYKRAV